MIWLRLYGFGMVWFVMFQYLLVRCGQMKWMETSTHVNDLWKLSSQTKNTHGGRNSHLIIILQSFSFLVKKHKSRILWKKHFTFFWFYLGNSASFLSPFLFHPIHVLLCYELVWCCYDLCFLLGWLLVFSTLCPCRCSFSW